MSVLTADISLKRGAFMLGAQFEAPLTGITAVFGPSGAGKSLLLSTLAGLNRIGAGRIVLGDRVLDDAAANQHTPPHLRGVGLVFQDARLLPHLSVHGNLAYALRRAPQAKLSLEDAVAYFDIAALLDRPTRNLSGGEKSRVALARALLSAPDLLLLDEPFAALDGPRRRAFIDTLKRMHERFALPMLVVTHQIDDAAALADHLVVLKAGRIIATGPFAATAAEPDVQALLDARDTGAAVRIGASRAWVRADHVLLSTQEPTGLSARHIWKAQIAHLATEEPNSILVLLVTESGPLNARVTPSAVSELRLERGGIVWAIIKAHSL